MAAATENGALDRSGHWPEHSPEQWPATVVPAVDELIALRRRIERLSIMGHRAHTRSIGHHRSRSRGRGMDFEESRPYQPGDDIRTIDWRVTARTTRAHTKVFREEREQPVHVMVDLRSTMFFGSTETKSVCAARLATAIAWATLRRGDRIGGMVFSDHEPCDIRPRRSHHAALRLIRALHDSAPRTPQPGPDMPPLRRMLEAIHRVGGTGATILVISDFHDLDEEGEQHLAQLSRHHGVVPVLIHDRLEQALPPPGIYPVGDDNRTSQLHTADPRFRKRFEQAFLRRVASLEQLAARLRSPLVRCATGTDVVQLLGTLPGTGARRPYR